MTFQPKMTAEQVLEARTLHADNDTIWTWGVLAKRYGVHRSTVKSAVTGGSWRWLKVKTW